MPAKKEPAGRCQVCSEVSNGFHFGVIVCRACAAFFRRTVALKLKYRCRYDGTCLIDKSMRCMCRECRFNKCQEVGMKADSVQLNRDSIGQSEHKDRSTVIVQSSPSSSSVCSLGNSLPTNREMLMARVSNIFDCAVLHKDEQSVSSVLDEMLRGYHRTQEVRKTVYADMKWFDPKSDQTEEEKLETTLKNIEIFVKMSITEIELAAHMVTYFRPFMDLPPNERLVLFRRFWPHFLKLERGYATYFSLGADVNDERVVLYNGTITPLQTVFSVFTHLSKLSESEVNRLFASSRHIDWNFINVPIKLLKPTEVEFIVMCGHLLWTTPGLQGISNETLQVSREARSKIYTELHRYYNEDVHLPVYAPRIGEFLSLISAVEKSIIQGNEDAMIIDLFDLVKVDLKMMDVLKP